VGSTEKRKSVVREYAEAIVIAVLLALFIRTFVVQAFKIPSGSMLPTLLIGDHLLVNKFIYGIRVPFTGKILVPIKDPKSGDIIVTGKNFGAGSSRQQAVDCFKSLEIPMILAESYGAIYERNAINAALPILTYDPKVLVDLQIVNGCEISVNLENSTITNTETGKSAQLNEFSSVQMEIYKRGGLLNK